MSGTDGEKGRHRGYAGRASETEKTSLTHPWEPNWKQTRFMQERLGLQTEADVRLDKNQRWFRTSEANMAKRKNANGSKLNPCLMWILIPLVSENTPRRSTSPQRAHWCVYSVCVLVCVVVVLCMSSESGKDWHHWWTMEMKRVIFLTLLGKLSLLGLCNIPPRPGCLLLSNLLEAFASCSSTTPCKRDSGAGRPG